MSVIEPELKIEPSFIVLPPPREIARGVDPETSKEAAFRCAPSRGSMAWAVLKIHYRHRGGLTDDEVREHLGGSNYDMAARKRRNELHRGGYLEDSGERRCTRTGARAIVWRITAKGVEYCEGHLGVAVELKLPREL